MKKSSLAWPCSAAVLLSLVLLAVLPSAARGEGEEVGEKAGEQMSTRRALIVAISQYKSGTGWLPIHANRDVPLIRGLLEVQGFTEISVLMGKRATRHGIVEAFRRHLLEPARPGDLVVFHYSGHGQRIPDDGDDEADGWDEAIVPWDAPAEAKGGYRGERHLRDDELSALLEALRQKVGPTGHVAVFLDSCFSGTPRGQEGVARGGPPLGPATDRRSGVDANGFFYEPLPSRGMRHVSAIEKSRSSWAVLSAARHLELAHELKDSQDRYVGSLTWALSRTLTRPVVAGQAEPQGELRTYRDLLGRVRQELYGRVPNVPQLEGEPDLRILGGGFVVPEPFVKVASVGPTGMTLQLAAGTAASLLPGSQVEIHRSGTLRMAPESLLAEGAVVRSEPFSAQVKLDRPVAAEELRRGRAFISRHSVGPVSLRLRFAGIDESLAGSLIETLEERIGGLVVTDEEPEVVIRASSSGAGNPPSILAETEPGKVKILGPVSADSPNLDRVLTRRLLDLARNRYFRRLHWRATALAVDLQLVALEVEGCSGEPVDPDSCAVQREVEVAAQRSWHPGEFYRLRAVHRGTLPAHIQVLALQPDGVIRLFWPRSETHDRTALRPGGHLELDGTFQTTLPVGDEVLLLIASREAIDLQPFVTAPNAAFHSLARGDGGEGPWTSLLKTLAPARSARAPSSAQMHTDSITLHIVGGTIAEDQAGGAAAVKAAGRP